MCEEKCHYLLCANYLFYEVVTIHPFVDGNGRLSRLLLSAALQRGGFPFPVPLTTGHHKARSQYMHAINAARRSRESSPAKKYEELVTMTLMAAYNRLINFLFNSGY